MSTNQTVLLVGGTGRTGQRVLKQLLSRGINVRAIVRSAHKLPAGAAENPDLTVIEASLLSVGDEDLQRHLRGCDAVGVFERRLTCDRPPTCASIDEGADRAILHTMASFIGERSLRAVF